jgi:serine protease Do
LKNTINISNKIILIFLILISLFSLNSCKSCSRSGRAELAKKNNLNSSSINHNNSTTNNEPKKPKKEIESKNENKILNIDNQNHSGNVSNLSTMYEELVKAVIFIYTQGENDSFQGSGFIVSKSGICVSNYHVFEGTYKESAKVKTYSGDIYEVGRIIEKNEDLDYIVFKIKTNNYKIFPYLSIANSIPKTGEDIFAIGTPKGLSHTLSKGIISQIRSKHEDSDMLQITAEITNGSSGGPLFNFNGEVVGITTAGMGEADLNFALNIQKLRLYRFLNN